MAKVSYGAKILNIRNCLEPTFKIYHAAVRYLVDIVFLHYGDISSLPNHKAQSFIQCLIISTDMREALYPEFERRFYKFPSYLRRDAITNAIGRVKSYKSQLALWEKDGRKGKKPHIDFNQDMMPCFYRGTMFRVHKTEGFQIKVYHNHDWVWQSIELRESDLRYVRRYCAGLKESAPVIMKRHHAYELRFTYDLPHSDRKFLKDVDITKAIGVDLGINTDAVCTAMLIDGTVTGQKFINAPVEKDRLCTLLDKIRKVQSLGSKHPYRLWSYVGNYNREIAVKTASAIVKFAVEQDAQVIVFENLSKLKGGAHGSKKQRIGLWRKADIQKRTEAMAARYGIRVTTVCAWNTSRLAFDGSGRIRRGADAGFTTNKLCRFANGKVYNCDLSASRNIAARYFIRCWKKTVPAEEWSRIQAKVPELRSRTRCTMATLISTVAVIKPLGESPECVA